MCPQLKNQGTKCIRFKISTSLIAHIVKMKNLFSHDFVHIKSLCKLENQLKIDQTNSNNNNKKVENIRYNYTICDSRFWRWRMENALEEFCFPSSSVCWWPSPKTVDWLDLLSCVWYLSVKIKILLYIGARYLLSWWVWVEEFSSYSSKNCCNQHKVIINRNINM